MKTHACLLSANLTILCLALIVSGKAEAAAPTPRNPVPAKPTKTVAPAQEPEIPPSVFVIPPSAKEGRNPFYPKSSAPVPVPIPRPTDVLSGIVLNGLTSPPKPTAMINGRTFEVGEPGEIKLPGGAKLLIKCEEIKADSAVIVIDGQRRELRLRFGI